MPSLRRIVAVVAALVVATVSVTGCTTGEDAVAQGGTGTGVRAVRGANGHEPGVGVGDAPELVAELAESGEGTW